MATQDLELVDPYVPRTTTAVDTTHPNGTTENNWAREHDKQTVLEQHVMFWDTVKDGIIWPLDTFNGFHALGFNLIFSLAAMFIIHLPFSYPTSSSWIPDPFFRIHVPKISKAKHGSDSGVYTKDGAFVPAKFEKLFAQFDQDGKGGLTWREGLALMKSNRDIADPFGWGATLFEWGTTYLMFWPKDGVVTKEQVRGVFDGSTFPLVAEALKKQKGE